MKDEAAAADAELQHGNGARLAGGAPFHVEADDEQVVAASADAVRLVQPRLHHGTGLGERCVEEVVLTMQVGRFWVTQTLTHFTERANSWF
jgi:hypothetical protein